MPRVVYDKQPDLPSYVPGSVAAIVGHMVAATKDFNVRDANDREVVMQACEEMLPRWIRAVQKAARAENEKHSHAE